MRTLLHKAWAFVRRDFGIESGYQASFVMGIVESIMLLVIFHFIGELVAPKATASLSRYGSQYFPFVIVGVAFARYFDLSAEDVFGINPHRSSYGLSGSDVKQPDWAPLRLF